MFTASCWNWYFTVLSSYKRRQVSPFILFCSYWTDILNCTSTNWLDGFYIYYIIHLKHLKEMLFCQELPCSFSSKMENEKCIWALILSRQIPCKKKQVNTTDKLHTQLECSTQYPVAFFTPSFTGIPPRRSSFPDKYVRWLAGLAPAVAVNLLNRYTCQISGDTFRWLGHCSSPWLPLPPTHPLVLGARPRCLLTRGAVPNAQSDSADSQPVWAASFQALSRSQLPSGGTNEVEKKGGG